MFAIKCMINGSIFLTALYLSTVASYGSNGTNCDPKHYSMLGQIHKKSVSEGTEGILERLARNDSGLIVGPKVFILLASLKKMLSKQKLEGWLLLVS